jgi:anti-sigma B factor antagonist
LAAQRRAGRTGDGKMLGRKGACMELSVATRLVSEHAVVEVGGEVDVYTAPRLRDRLNEVVGSGQRHLVVDLTKVDFLDSTGIGVLVGVYRRLVRTDGSLVLVCPHEKLLKILRIAGMDTVFKIYGSVPEATAASPTPDA